MDANDIPRFINVDNIPKHVIDHAKWAILDTWGYNDVAKAKESVDRYRNGIIEDIAKYKDAKKHYHECLNLKLELTEFLKSIGQYEESKTEAPETN